MAKPQERKSKKKKKAAPLHRFVPENTVVRGVRLPVDVDEAVKKCRGEVDFGVWARELIEGVVIDPTTAVCRDIAEGMSRRNVSLEQLIEYFKKTR